MLPGTHPNLAASAMRSPPESPPDFPGGGNPPSGTIDPGKSVPRATRWLRALLRAVYRNDGDTHGAVTSGPCPRRRVVQRRRISRLLSSRIERARSRRSESQTTRAFIPSSPRNQSLRSAPSIAKTFTLRRRGERRFSERIAIHSIIRDRAIHILTSRSEHYCKYTVALPKYGRSRRCILNAVVSKSIDKFKNYDTIRENHCRKGGKDRRFPSSIDVGSADRTPTNEVTATTVEG